MLWSILHLSYSSEPVMRCNYKILLKSPPPLTLLAGSAPGHKCRKNPWCDWTENRIHSTAMGEHSTGRFHLRFSKILLTCKTCWASHASRNLVLLQAKECDIFLQIVLDFSRSYHFCSSYCEQIDFEMRTLFHSWLQLCISYRITLRVVNFTKRNPQTKGIQLQRRSGSHYNSN